MKNKLSFTLVGAVLIFTILACTVTINDGGGGSSVGGSGTVIEEDRTVSNVTSVELAMPGHCVSRWVPASCSRIEAGG